MAIEVRPIARDDMSGWLETLHMGFHLDPPTAGEVAYRLDVFGQDLSRTLGAFDGSSVVGTLLSFSTELTLPGGTTLVADAVAAATVRSTHRRRGLLTRMLGADLRAGRERGEAASILYPAEYPIYGRFGFGPATQQVSLTLERAATRFTRSAEGSVELVDAERMLELAPPLFERFRRAQPGQIDRAWSRWDTRLGVRSAPGSALERPLRCVVYRAASGSPDGYLLYRVESVAEAGQSTTTLRVIELVSLSAEAYVGLWRYCAEVDLIGRIAARRAVDEPLPWLLDNARAALSQVLQLDQLWLRPLDTSAMLAARRYATDGRLVLEVRDPLDLCGGKFALEGGPQGASCQPTQASPELAMGTQALGAISLGGVSLHVLAEVGLIEELRPGALATAERMFRAARAPWCATFF
jgi:predicted acetyltransferase